MSQDPNLPPGCTNADIDARFGDAPPGEECENCGGTGKLGSEFCGADVTDTGLCSKCKEHAENEKCPECEDGIIEDTRSAFEIRADAEEAAAEDRAGERRYD